MEPMNISTDTVAADDPRDQPPPDAELLQLKAELSEVRRQQEEQQQSVGVLEQRLAQSRAELMAVSDELRWELQKREQERHEMKVLGDDLLQEKRGAEILRRELESFGFAVSHDLRAPLRHVSGFSQALVEHLGEELDAAGKSYLDCIVRAGRKMDSMIEALLSLSRITRQDLHPCEVDLSQLVRECAEELRQSASGRRVVVDIEERLTVRGDPALFKIAMDNLVGNAWKFTAGKEVAHLEFGCKKEGGGTLFYLSDDGAGFDMRYADRLFVPFQRMHAESEFAGRGMGLATVQRIIRRHGGRVWIDAILDQGATVYFTLPD